MKRMFLILGVVALASCEKENVIKERILQEQEDVLTKEGIEQSLSTFEKVKYTELPEHYKTYSHPEDKFKSELKNRSFYKINRNNIHTKVCGKFCAKDFLAKDEYYKAYQDSPDPEFIQYWLIDKDVLFMMLELIHSLDDLGMNKYGFHIRNSHRHPKHNTDNNGASYSQHMFGKAIDIGIDDINNDGEETQDDKTIVYDLLQKIVGSKGGLGKYPGTMNLHFDCRGFKARWDVP